ncbi:hypothetical protein ACN2XU_12095 [Primorskyibacter sp. 2E107]|uniref:hypothetical protein n=1 Tax=Primorskyibacter sp. 2E107 TaxID=3403458 RepID=UPI003AF66123
MTRISFLCPPELDGLIPPPMPAGRLLPEWFWTMPRAMGVHLPASTIRACLPVTDIMTLGWLLRLPCDIRMMRDPATGQMTFQWDQSGPITPLALHHPSQIGADRPPFRGKQPMKFINPWRVVLPSGWSALFVQPANHFDLPFKTFEASVDCDALDVPVNIPFLWTDDAPEYNLPAGTPIVQVVPYQRAAMTLTGEIRAETPQEAEARATAKHRKHSEESVYVREWRRRHERMDPPDR